MAPRIHPQAGRGTGVNPNGRDYPFVAPRSDLQGLLADLQLVTNAAWAAPLRICWLSGFDRYFDDTEATNSDVGGVPPETINIPTATHIVDLLIVDAQNLVVFDSTTAQFATRAFGVRWQLHQWTTANGCLRVLQHTAFEDLEDVRVIPHVLYPAQGELDARTYLSHLVGISSIRLGINTLDEPFTLRAGYNIAISASPVQRGLRKGYQVTLDATAGGGLGKYPGCQQTDIVLRKINNVTGTTDGRFYLNGTGCHAIGQKIRTVGELTLPVPHTLKINNDCRPCCSCEDYVLVYKALSRLNAKAIEICRLVEQYRERYDDDTDDLRRRIECQKSHPWQYSVKASGKNRVTVKATYHNFRDVCMRSPHLYFVVKLRLRATRIWDIPRTAGSSGFGNTTPPGVIPQTPDDYNQFVPPAIGYYTAQIPPNRVVVRTSDTANNPTAVARLRDMSVYRLMSRLWMKPLTGDCTSLGGIPNRILTSPGGVDVWKYACEVLGLVTSEAARATVDIVVPPDGEPVPHSLFFYPRQHVPADVSFYNLITNNGSNPGFVNAPFQVGPPPILPATADNGADADVLFAGKVLLRNALQGFARYTDFFNKDAWWLSVFSSATGQPHWQVPVGFGSPDVYAGQLVVKAEWNALSTGNYINCEFDILFPEDVAIAAGADVESLTVSVEPWLHWLEAGQSRLDNPGGTYQMSAGLPGPGDLTDFEPFNYAPSP